MLFVIVALLSEYALPVNSLLPQFVYHARHITRPETVVDIDYANAAGATVQHSQQRRNSLKTAP